MITSNGKIVVYNTRTRRPIDPDAHKLLLVMPGVTDAQSLAIEYIISALKEINVWNKLIALYLFVGGTADYHKWNAKDPRDADDAYRIIWNGVLTHSATGVKGNGSSGYGDTKIIPANHLQQNSCHVSFYNRTVTGGSNAIEIGSRGTTIGISFKIRDTTLRTNFDINNAVGNVYVNNTNGTLGFFTNTRTTSTSLTNYRNGVSQGSVTRVSSTPLSNYSLTILANNAAGVMANFSNKECALCSIGEALDSTEALNFYNVVQNYQILLNRQL